VTFRRLIAPVAFAAASVLVLAGCASSDTGAVASDDRLQVVASTNVYGQIAEEIGGDLVAVSATVSSDGQDPHSFEPTARDQLTVSNADLIIENGGGYDAFIDALIESSGSTAPVITAVEFSHDWPDNAGHDAEAEGEHADEDAHAEEGDDHAHVEGFNEHVWYDPHTIEQVAEAIAEELAALQPDDAATFEQNAEAFIAEIAVLEGSLGEIDATHAGAQVFVTEPVPVYLVAAAGLENVTPNAFSEAVEEGQDVPPATLLESLTLLQDGGVRVVIQNTQTGGAETTQIVDEADAIGIPVIAFSETLPEGQTYISWMQANIEALAGALTE
jgi:zinc/manganese transport system substrate-binding protein